MILLIETSILIVAGILVMHALKPAAEGQFEKELKSRTLLDDDDFIEKYYADATMPRQIPIKLRRVLAKMLGQDWVKALPNDNPAMVYDDIDPWDIFRGACQAFGVSITLEEAGQLDGSFDSIARFLAVRTHAADPVP